MWRYLREHPDVYMAPKELQYFTEHFDMGTDWYRAHFADARIGQACGEATADYMAREPAMVRLSETIPDARLIALLRNPVDRAPGRTTGYYAHGDARHGRSKPSSTRRWRCSLPRGQELTASCTPCMGSTTCTCEWCSICSRGINSMSSYSRRWSPNHWPSTRRFVSSLESTPPSFHAAWGDQLTVLSASGHCGSGKHPNAYQTRWEGWSPASTRVSTSSTQRWT